MNRQNEHKKIILLINTLMFGGAERIVVDLVEKINKKDFNLHVVYMKDHKYFNDGDRTSFLEEIKNTGVAVSCLGGKNKSVIKESIALWKLFRKEKPDILQTFLPYGGTVGRVVGRLAGVKYILSVQCNLKMAHTPKTYWLDRFTLPLADAWTGATEMIEEEYSGTSEYFSEEKWNRGRRHFTVLSGVDVEQIQQSIKKTNVADKKKEAGIKEGNKVVTMCARLISWKGHDDLIKALALLPKNIELVLVGGGGRMEELKKMTENLSVSDRVHFLGNRSDLFELLAITDLYVQSFTRANDGSVWKGPNTSQMVAAAAKVPAISTNVPMIGRFMQDGISGKIAELNNPRDLAEKIEYQLNNETEAREMAEKAFNIVSKKYSIETMIYAYENIYRKLCKNL